MPILGIFLHHSMLLFKILEYLSEQDRIVLFLGILRIFLNLYSKKYQHKT